MVLDQLEGGGEVVGGLDGDGREPLEAALREADDHVILFLVDKKRVPEVERLFAVGATFL